MQEIEVAASIEADPGLAEHVCAFWRGPKICENYKWLLGCAFGLGRDPANKPLTDELKFLSRLAGYRIKASPCGGKCRVGKGAEGCAVSDQLVGGIGAYV